MKQKILALLALVVIVAGLTAVVQAEQQQVRILEDTTVGWDISNPIQDIYFMRSVQIGSGAQYVGYAPEIYGATKYFPDGTPLKAKLVLGRENAYYGNEEKYSLYKITERYDFMFGTNKLILSDKVAEGVINGSATIEFEITDLVNFWAQNPAENYGFAVVQDVGTPILVATSEYPENGAAVKPHVVIEPDLPPAPRIEDVNKDGKVNLWDELPILIYLQPEQPWASWGIPQERMIVCGKEVAWVDCDVNTDGVISPLDDIKVALSCDHESCSPE